MDSHGLRFLADQIDRHQDALSRLAFCFDRYLEFVEDGRKPSLFADGTVAMDAAKSTEQLKSAINNVLGRHTEDEAA